MKNKLKLFFIEDEELVLWDDRFPNLGVNTQKTRGQQNTSGTTIEGDRLMSYNQSETMSARWKLCDRLSKKLDVSKTEVFNHLSKFSDHADKILKGNKDSIDFAIKIIGGKDKEKGRGIQDLNPLLWAIRKYETVEQARQAFEAATSSIDLAPIFWALKQFEDIERARKLFELAANIVEELE